MVVKTITVTEDAYNALKKDKEENESFSEVILRTHGKKLTVKEICGILKESPEEGKAWSERVKKIHAQFGKDMEERQNKLKKQWEGLHT